MSVTMLKKKYRPTELLTEEERPAIPIIRDPIKKSFRKFWIVLRLVRIFFIFCYLGLLRRLTFKSMGKILSQFCQQNGVLWIKLGQLLSMRSDLFPSELCQELGRLQDRVEGFSPALVKTILEEEIGGPLETVFSRFETEPCAAASIAQVHKAYLIEEETWVAVKVRRPDIDEIFLLDMEMIRWLFHLFQQFSIMNYMRWPDMLAEMEQVFLEELDYRYEVANQQRLRKTLSHHGVYVPKIFNSYCTRKVLVMEFIEGVAMSDFLRIMRTDPGRAHAWMEDNQIQPDRVGKSLFLSYLRQVLEDNLFHADLHPGNIVLLKKNRISLLDFGSMGTSEGDLLRKYDIFLQALSTGEFSKAVDVFLLIMPFVPPAQLSRVKDEMQRRLQAWDSRCRVSELPYKEKSTNMVFDEMTRVMGKYGVTINWAFFKVLRGWTTMDTSLRELIPEADLARMMQSYIRRRESREFRKVMGQLPSDMLKIQNLIDYPRELSEMAIYRGASVRRLAQVFEGTTTRVSRLAATAFGIGSVTTLILIALTGLIALGQHTSVFKFSTDSRFKDFFNLIPHLDIQIWILSAVILFKALFSFTKLSRRFRKQS